MYAYDKRSTIDYMIFIYVYIRYIYVYVYKISGVHRFPQGGGEIYCSEEFLRMKQTRWLFIKLYSVQIRYLPKTAGIGIAPPHPITPRAAPLFSLWTRHCIQYISRYTYINIHTYWFVLNSYDNVYQKKLTPLPLPEIG